MPLKQKKNNNVLLQQNVSHQSQTKETRSFQIWELPDDHDGFKALPSIDSIDDIPGDDDMTKPMKFHLEIKIEGDDQTNPKGLDNFVSEFKNDPCYMVESGASGRGSRMIDKNVVSLNKPVKELLDRGTEVKAKLSGAEREWVDAPWFFSYHGKMKSVGCEYAFLGSLKVAWTGSRVVRLASFKQVSGFMATTTLNANAASINDCATFLSNAMTLFI